MSTSAATKRLSRVSSLSVEDCRLLVESVVDHAIFMLDVDGFVATWNRGAERIKGYRAEEIIGKHFSTFYPPEDIESHKPERELMIAIEQGRVEDEGWRVRKDGTRFWANVVITALRDDSGVLRGFGKVTRDLTLRRLAERQLLEAEQRFHHLVDAVSDYAIFMLDTNGRVATWNLGAERIKGYLADEIIGQHFSLFYTEQDRNAGLPEQILEAVKREGRVEREGWRRRKDGSTFWANVILTAIRNPHGEVTAIAKVTRDLSERRDAEEALRVSEERFRLLVEGVADYALYMLDPSGNVATWNLGAERLKGYTAPEIVGKHFSVFFAEPDLRKGIPEEELRIAREVGRLEQEGFRVRKDGTRFWAHSVVTALRNHNGELIGFAKLTRDLTTQKQAEEITRNLWREQGLRAAAEENERKIRESQEVYRKLASDNARLYAAEKKAREHLLLLARAGEVFSATLEYEQTLSHVVQITMPMLADFAFFDVVEGDEVRRIAAAYEDPECDALIKATHWVRSERKDKNLCALSSGETGFHPNIDREFLEDVAVNREHLELLQKLELCSMITVPLRARGETLGSLTACFGKSRRHHTPEDKELMEELARRSALALLQVRLYQAERQAAKQAEESARHAAEEARRAAEEARRAEHANRVKDEFLATVSHELRTPLNAILGWSALLANPASDASLEKGLGVIYRNARAQARIVEDILDVSRIITGKLRLDLKPTDLVAVVREAIEVVRPAAVAKHITIDFSPAHEVALLVADPERLRQVVWNLLSNAVKFTDARGQVFVTTEQLESNLSVSVRDTGRGIEPEFLPHVFDRFRQADGSTTRRFGGLGLGLSIVRHIVELHGGRVFAESAGERKGSLFRVVLPVRAVAPEARSEDEKAGTLDAQPPKITLPDLRILVVDDDPDARELLVDLLRRAGALVEQADSATSGFELVQSFRPQILVSDIGMPDEDGYTLARRVRALGPSEGGGIPCIALTAYTAAEDRTKALAAGFTMHISKPVYPDELLAVISNLSVLARRRDSSVS